MQRLLPPIRPRQAAAASAAVVDLAAELALACDAAAHEADCTIAAVAMARRAYRERCEEALADLATDHWLRLSGPERRLLAALARDLLRGRLPTRRQATGISKIRARIAQGAAR